MKEEELDKQLQILKNAFEQQNNITDAFGSELAPKILDTLLDKEQKNFSEHIQKLAAQNDEGLEYLIERANEAYEMVKE